MSERVYEIDRQCDYIKDEINRFKDKEHELENKIQSLKNESSGKSESEREQYKLSIGYEEMELENITSRIIELNKQLAEKQRELEQEMENRH